MLLAIVLLAALALVFVKLGALSVWVTVLVASLKGLAVLVAVVALVAGWRVWKRRRDGVSFNGPRVIKNQE